MVLTPLISAERNVAGMGTPRGVEWLSQLAPSEQAEPERTGELIVTWDQGHVGLVGGRRPAVLPLGSQQHQTASSRTLLESIWWSSGPGTDTPTS